MNMKHLKIVFTGSSIIALWEDLALHFPGIEVLNTAISGSHTPDIYARLDELVIAHAPDIVGYYCGSNDINYGATAPAIVDTVVKSYDIIASRLSKAIFIYLSIIKAPQKSDRWDVVEGVNTALSQFASRSSRFRFIDVNPVFFTEAGQPQMEFYQEDKLHLTPAAYAALGAYLAPRVLQVIAGSSTMLP